jgi:5-methylcytosine-specific restriction endonuclease McrA
LSALSGIVADAKANRLAHRNAWLLSGYKHCQDCGEEIPVKCFGDTNRVFCSSCKGIRHREKERLSPKKKSKRKIKKDSPMRAIYDQWISLGNKPCSRCEARFPVSTFGDCNRLYCQNCKGEVARELSRIKGKKKGLHRRRAKKFNVPYENVDRLYVFQRDEYKCWLCGKETLKDFAISEGSSCPHPDSPTLDHVIPLSKGGPHSYSNTKCACFLCNCLKGDKIDFVKCPEADAPHTGGQCDFSAAKQLPGPTRAES